METARFIRAISVWGTLFFISLGHEAVLGAGEAENVRQFGVLCLLAKEAEGIIASTGVEESGRTIQWDAAVKFTKKLGSIMDRLNSTEDHRIMVDLEEGVQVSVESGQPALALRNRLRLFEGKMTTLARKIDKLKNDSVQSLNKAKTEAALALGGEQVKTLAEAGPIAIQTLGSNQRNAVCKEPSGTADGKTAGSSIPADILCLCAHNQASETKLCGPTMTQQVNAAAAFSSVNSDWSLLSTACNSIASKPLVSSAALRDRIRDFEGELGRGVATSSNSAGDKAHWILGQIKGTGVCDGNSNGVCVNYAGGACSSANGSCRRGQIPWLVKLASAETELKAAEKNGQEAETLILKAESLMGHAITILLQANETKTGTSITNSKSDPTERSHSRDGISQPPSTVAQHELAINVQAMGSKWLALAVLILY